MPTTTTHSETSDIITIRLMLLIFISKSDSIHKGGQFERFHLIALETEMLGIDGICSNS